MAKQLRIMAVCMGMCQCMCSDFPCVRRRR